MSFDPYHKWLGIAPGEEHPPNHYRLLGINLFEADLDVISNAADQRMVHIRSFQGGKHAVCSQKILNEIASARVCLLDPPTKADYDAVLRAKFSPPPTTQLGTPPAKAVSPITPSLEVAANPVGPVVTDRGIPSVARPTRRPENYYPLAIAALAGLLFIMVALIFIFVADKVRRDEVAENSQIGELSTPPPPRAVTGSDTSTNVEAEKVTTPQKPPVKPTPIDPPPKPSVERPKSKSPEPDAPSLTSTRQRLELTLAGKSAQDIFQEATSRQDYDADTFALFCVARDRATAGGNLRMAFGSIDELDGRFTIDALGMKADLLPQLQENVSTKNDYRELAQIALHLVEQADKVGRRDDARRCASIALGTARKSGDAELAKEATMAVVKLQQP